jgi:thiol-disulfide isomerase/thioredoxin
MDSILKKPGIKYLARVNSLANLYNNSININDSNGAYNILFKMRTIHGKLLCKYHKTANGKKCTKRYFYISCLQSVLNLINDKVVDTELLFNTYINDNNIDPKSLKIVRSSSSKSSSGKSVSSSLSESDNLKMIVDKKSKLQSQSLSQSDTSDSYSDLGDTLSDRFRKLNRPTGRTPSVVIAPPKIKAIVNPPKIKGITDDLPLFNGKKSEDVVKRENIKSEMNANNSLNFNNDIPSLLFFYNPGCPACTKTKPHWDSLITSINKVFKTNGQSFNIMDINLSDPANENLASLFQIQYIPTIVMMESSKKPMAKIEKLEGMADKQRINTFIKESYDKFTK